MCLHPPLCLFQERFVEPGQLVDTRQIGLGTALRLIAA
jgi:hypothetical protein